MNSKRHTWLLYLITTTIVLTVFVQIYWNYKNYKENKKVFINTVQESLDNALDTYFSKLARNKFYISSSNKRHSIEKIKIQFLSTTDSLQTNSLKKSLNEFTLPETDKIKFIQVNKMSHLKSVANNFTSNSSNDTKKLPDTFLAEEMTSIFISITENDIQLKKLKSFLENEFNRKQIKAHFKLHHYYGETLQATSDSALILKNPLVTYAKTSYLKENEKIALLFNNETLYVLKKGFIGILLSFLLSFAIMSSIFYLLNIIKKQKQIAAIKNDFISNITHEFKTPITTIGLATDAIKEFTIQKNYIKTNEYLNITKNQLNKLQLMVEKILETSVLNTDSLQLEKMQVNIIPLIHQIVDKQKLNTKKPIYFNSESTSVLLNIDSFHFENAINNLIENAIKYGGNRIEIILKSYTNTIEIFINDNGQIDKAHQHNIFDKFYRISKGNMHDVKGFGIGLYYTKKIIEKHQGNIILTNDKQTSFKITLVK